MNAYTGIIIAIAALACIYVLQSLSKSEAVYEKTNNSNREYLVQNLDDKQEASEMLDTIHNRIQYLLSYLKTNINSFPEYKPYIERLLNGTKNTKLTENSPYGKFTSYTLNKGEEISLCLRYIKTNEIHDINLVMYVVLHELSHIACPELGHTALFKKIFIFLLKVSFTLKIYSCVDYRNHPELYCNGMVINESLVDCSKYEPNDNQQIDEQQLYAYCPKCIFNPSS